MRAIAAACPCCSFSSVCSTLIAAIIATLALCVPTHAQDWAQPASTAPRPLITQAIDESRLTTLKGNTHPLARPEFDLGTAPASLPMDRMLLVLKRSPEQETALRKMLDDQQDKKSPTYHKWLTPEQYGQQFGPTDSDVQAITSWLQSRGFQVGPTKGRTALEFSGTAGQVREAFHTTIHKYIVNGAQHWANASDPQIPSALTGAVSGVLTLHNFLKKPHSHVSKTPAALKIVPGKRPQVTFTENGKLVHALGPQDYATIYNINPTYNRGINGTGITVGIVGRSNLFNSPQDVTDFRSVFGLCCGNLDIILNGPDPGDLGGGEEAEATLDATWAGAVAPNATIDLVVSASTNTTDGVDLSEAYIVENNLADVMTESFGSCEYFNTDAQVAFTNGLAEQAAAQGISYFVSTGDNGAEGCDDPNASAASFPISVNLLASTPFNVAVGGTTFDEGGLDSKYWGTEPPVTESAISYIPEDVWNESCSTATCGSNANLSAGSGGASSGNQGIGGTFIGFEKPYWQAGVTGIPNDGVRDLPDVSLTSASHDPYLVCLEGSCGQNFIYFVWGTSAAAPSFAGIMALVDQQAAITNPGQSFRQGQANYVLYRLAVTENATLSQCNGSAGALPASTCIFNDITSGNNAVPGELNYGLSNAKYQAGVGYDLAAGLGSVNVENLVSQWSTVTFNPTTTVLELNGGSAVNVSHSQSVPVNVAVTPSSGTLVPTGDVVLYAASGPIGSPSGQTALNLFTLASGAVSGSTSMLPGGTYNVTAHYSGDATYAPSDSAVVSVVVTPEPSTTTFSVLSFDAFGNPTTFTTGPFGSFVYLRADVAGVSGIGNPSGSVTFQDAGNPVAGATALALNNQGNTATPNGILSFDAGTHTMSASYSGDASFNPSNSTQSQSFTITPGFFAAIPSNQANVVISAPGSSGQTSVTVSSSTGFSGTIKLACSGLPSESICTFSPASITASGTPKTMTASITITTKAATAVLDSEPRNYLLAQWMIGTGLMLSIGLVGGRGHGGRRHGGRGYGSRGFFFMLALALVIAVPGCGGGGGSNTKAPPPDPGTPTGFSTIVVTATSGSTVSRTSFALIVQ